jgi:hypothetical protein
MNPPSPVPVPDLATQWSYACRLYPIYFELAREFAIDVQSNPELEAGVETPGQEVVEQAVRWLDEMDERIQVHQLRQFLQTSAVMNPEGVLVLLQHFLGKTPKSDAIRDKVDFLLVQYFSQLAPTGVDDAEVDLGYVAQTLQPVLGQVELKAPVWLNALDRILETARRCKSLDELLHGGVLEQGRKAKTQAGELYYLPVALTAFTRFGYLMRRAFFRLMLGDLNIILDGLTELDEKGVQTIDCRRAQFSAQEPIIRLRMICQSWKVMFQAEYSSGSPLRMLVDLRASVEHALGRGKAPAVDAKSSVATAAGKPANAVQAEVAAQPLPAPPSAPIASAKAAGSLKPATPGKPVPAAAKAAAGAGSVAACTPKTAAMPTVLEKAQAPEAEGKADPKVEPPEFEVSSGSEWDPDAASSGKKA